MFNDPMVVMNVFNKNSKLFNNLHVWFASHLAAENDKKMSKNRSSLRSLVENMMSEGGSLDVLQNTPAPAQDGNDESSEFISTSITEYNNNTKPSFSYIGLIAKAILSSGERRMVLSDIYQWIMDNYSYFRSRGPGWRNSIRHNLSLNDCFIKVGKSANGKGNYWGIHPANMSDFIRGDFRRRRAQRKVHRALGLISMGHESDTSDDHIFDSSFENTNIHDFSSEEANFSGNNFMIRNLLSDSIQG